MAKHKALNNLLHFYIESDCSNLKVFTRKFNLSYNTLTEQIRNDVEPTEDTIKTWCINCHLPRVYFNQERPEPTQDELHLWRHEEVRYKLSEIYDAIGMVAEDIDFDRNRFEKILKEIHK